jgi:hypothetical protein
MDYQLFDNIIDWVKSGGYTCTGVTPDDEIYYGKTINSFDLDDGNEIKFKSESIKFPKIYSDLYSKDFLIVCTQIYKEHEKLEICVDVDECDFTDKPEIINIHIDSHVEQLNIKKYFSQTFIDYKLGDLDLMVQNIGNKLEFVTSKTFEADSDNLVFVQINVIMNTRLSKYIKKDRCDVFLLNDNFLAKRKADNVKNYIDMSTNTKRQQTEIIQILNSYYDNLTIIKKPSTNELIFGIKGQEFLKKVWNKFEGTFYLVMNEQIKL